MNANMDRFQPPTAADDKARCQGCGYWMNYEELDDHGRCPDCATKPAVEEDECPTS